MRSGPVRWERIRATSSVSFAGTGGASADGGVQGWREGVAAADGRAMDPAITRLECGRLAKAQSRFSFGQNAHSLPPDAVSDRCVLLRVQLLASGMGLVQRSPSSRVR